MCDYHNKLPMSRLRLIADGGRRRRAGLLQRWGATARMNKGKGGTRRAACAKKLQSLEGPLKHLPIGSIYLVN